MKFIVPPTSQPVLSLVGSDKVFSVHRVFCIGQNYYAHALEMGSDPKDKRPFFYFAKPITALAVNPKTIAFPADTENLHHEVELVVALGKGGRNLDEQQAEECIVGYATGVDLTKRDLQTMAKEKGRPWESAKGFDDSAPISSLVLKSDVGSLASGEISLKVNGEQRQKGDLKNMILSPVRIISFLSQSMELYPGDLIYTGTPEGVSPLRPKDQVSCQIAKLPAFTFTMGS